VTAVLGLDDRNTARPWHAIAPRAGGGAPLTPLQVAKAYQFPAGDGHGQTVGVIELGGAFVQKDLDVYLASLNVPRTTVTVVPVMGAKPTSDGPGGADGEVMLDVEIIAAIAPAANLRVYFAPNTTAGFLAAINQAFHDGAGVISISWGGPESTWTRQAMRPTTRRSRPPWPEAAACSPHRGTTGPPTGSLVAACTSTFPLHHRTSQAAAARG